MPDKCSIKPHSEDSSAFFDFFLFSPEPIRDDPVHFYGEITPFACAANFSIHLPQRRLLEPALQTCHRCGTDRPTELLQKALR